MKIKYKYCSKISWRVDLQGRSSPFEIFGKDNSKRIRSSLIKLDESDYRFEMGSIDEKFIDKFNKIYIPYIESKEGKVYDIKDKILYHPPHNFPYKSLNFLYKDEFLGAVIFSDREDCIVNGFRVLPKEINIKIASNISMLADYNLYKYAIETGKKYIAKGKDRNPYGQNASIGLAIYKLKSGTLPYTTKSPKDDGLFSEFEWDERSNILLFGLSESEEQINEAKLFLPFENPKENAMEKYAAIINQKSFKVELVGL